MKFLLKNWTKFIFSTKFGHLLSFFKRIEDNLACEKGKEKQSIEQLQSKSSKQKATRQSRDGYEKVEISMMNRQNCKSLKK